MKSIKFFIAAVCTASLFFCSACKSNNSDSAKQDENAEQVTENVGSNVHVLAPGEVFDVNTNPKCLTIVDFNATWCGPCKAFGPIFEAASVKYADNVKFISVDVDAHSDLAQSLEISSIPAVLFIHTDGTKDWNIGFMEADEFDAMIKAALDK